MNNRFAKGGGGPFTASPINSILPEAAVYLFSKSKPYLFLALGPLKRSICGTNWVYTGRTAGVVHERVGALSDQCATKNTLEKYAI